MIGGPISATVHLRFLDVPVIVETNSLRVAAAISAYFEQFLDVSGRAKEARSVVALVGSPQFDAGRMKLHTPSAPGREPKESWYDRGRRRFILKNRTGVLITLEDERATIAGDLERHTNQVINLVGTMFGLALVERGYCMVHASAVIRSGSDDVTVFLGNSGSGKSSLALQILERGGYDYLSNDRVLLLPRHGRVHAVGLPKKPRVNPGTLLASARLSRLLPRRRHERYSSLSREDLWQLEEKRDVDVRRWLRAHWRLEGSLRQIYVLDWRPGDDGLRVDPVGEQQAEDALLATSKNFGPYDRRAERTAEEPDLARIARAAKTLRVTGRADPSKLAAALTSASAGARSAG